MVMSWHIHYMYNRDGFYDFCTAFEEKFGQYFDPENGPLCPFGPNYGDNTFKYICSLERCTNFLDKSSSSGSPWNDPQRAFYIPVELIEETWEWSKNNKFKTDLLRHPNTGCMHDDHGIRCSYFYITHATLILTVHFPNWSLQLILKITKFLDAKI